MEPIEIKKLKETPLMKHKNGKMDIPQSLQNHIEIFWTQLTKQNPQFTRGISYTVTKIEQSGDKVEILCEDTDYAHYMYGMKYPMEEKYICRNLWAGVLIETLDHCYVIGEMESHTSSPHRMQISGGGIEPAEIIEGKVETQITMARELKEELGIDVCDERAVIEKEIYFKKGNLACATRQKDDDSVGIIYKMKWMESKDQLNKNYEDYKEELKKEGKEVEFERIHFVPKDQVEEFCEENQKWVVSYLKLLLLMDKEIK